MGYTEFIKKTNKITLLLACCDDVKQDRIKACINDTNSIIISQSVSDGKSALKALEKNYFSAAVIYLGLFGNDGLWVIEQIKRNNYKNMRLIAVNDTENIMFSKLALSCGADYCLTEPFDTDILVSRIKQLCSDLKEEQQNEEKSQCVRLSEIITKIGIRPGLKGYSYIKRAVAHVIENPTFLSGVTKNLYPEIAMEFKTQPKCVERDIRHCINVSWYNAQSLYKNIFGFEFYKKPTNKELIHAIAEYVSESEGIEIS